MPRFFVTSSQIGAGTVSVTGEDAHHIARSLRMAAGEIITVADETGTEYTCRLTAFLPDRVEAAVLESHPTAAEPPCRIVLYQALPKGDKLDTVIQKAVECGVAAVVPFESSRCVARAKPEAEPKKTERRQKIAKEAAGQCGRGLVPAVLPTTDFRGMLREAGKADRVYFCYEGAGTKPIGALWRRDPPQKGQTVALVIGSEGGFSKEEAAAAEKAGFSLTGLGPRILRTETAAAFALACLCCLSELNGTNIPNEKG